MRMLAGLGAVALFVAALATTYLLNGYELFVLSLVGLTALVGIGLNILFGLTGQISLGHVGFYALGAYTVAILTKDVGMSFWLALPLAGLLAGVAGTLLAVPAMRVRGPYLAMVTIAFGFIIEHAIAEWDSLTGGWNGIFGIPMPQLAGHAFDQQAMSMLVIVLVAAGLLFYAFFRASRWGQAMRALQDSEIAAQSLGLNPIVLRTAAFFLSALITGIAGGVFAVISSFISPGSFPFLESILFLLVVMIGGTYTVLGPLVGALVVVLIPETLSWLGEYRFLFVGVLLLLVLRLAPQGLVGLVTGLWRGRGAGDRISGDDTDPECLTRENHAQGLRVDDVGISFGGVKAVQALSLAAKPGEITSLIGPNGAGKTTALNLIAGFYRPDSGTVYLGNTPLKAGRAHAAARAGIARTYQTTRLFAQMTVLENLAVAIAQGRLRLAHGRAARREAAGNLLSFVGYDGDLQAPAGALAHIDKRLVEIARALALGPDVLLLDEPAAGLGADDTRRVGALLRRVADMGYTVLLIEHDMELVMGISDRVVVLDAGQKIADAVPAVVRRDPAVLKAYLGESELSGRARESALAVNRSQPLLRAEGLGASYGASPALEDAALEVADGEFVAVLGANGAGKTTLMHALCGLHRPVDGRVLLLGERIETLSAHQVAGRGLVLVPEGRQVFGELSVIDNIRLGAFKRRAGDIGAEVEALLERFPRLDERRHQRAGLLSGGEQQMLAIARGLIARPRVLLLDEPSLGLAPTIVQSLYAILAELRDEGVTILLVDQMAQLALSVADRAYVLESGEITQQGDAETIAHSDTLEAAYLGGDSNADSRAPA